MGCDREAMLPRDTGINRCKPPRGIIEVDPGGRGRHFDATDFGEAIGLGCRDVGLGASLLGMTLGGIGHILADAHARHRHAVTGIGEGGWTRDGEIVETDAKFGVRKPAGGYGGRPARLDIEAASLDRSEEHTSELQSLMRISYAVFCLKKKKTYNNT